MATWIKPHKHGSSLFLYIQPGASQSELAGEHDERLKVKIKAPPRDGEANECLIKFFSEVLEISKREIHLIAGESSRQKTLLVELPPEIVLTLVSLKLPKKSST